MNDSVTPVWDRSVDYAVVSRSRALRRFQRSVLAAFQPFRSLAVAGRAHLNRFIVILEGVAASDEV